MVIETEGWRERLSEAEVGKISMELQLWLSGESAESLGLLPAEGEEVGTDTAQVSAYLESPPDGEQIEKYATLGLEMIEGVPVPSGAVTQEQLLDLAREPGVLRLEAVGTSSLSMPGLKMSIGSPDVEPSGEEEE